MTARNVKWNASGPRKPRKARATTPMIATAVRYSSRTDGPFRAINGHLLCVDFPIRTESEMNASDEPTYATTARKRSQHAIVEAVLSDAAARTAKPWLWLPLRITMVRVGPKRMDCDNATSATKFVRDAIASWLGVNDGDDAIVWVYRREIAPAFGVRAEIRSGSAVVAEIDAEHRRALDGYKEMAAAVKGAAA